MPLPFPAVAAELPLPFDMRVADDGSTNKLLIFATNPGTVSYDEVRIHRRLDSEEWDGFGVDVPVITGNPDQNPGVEFQFTDDDGGGGLSAGQIYCYYMTVMFGTAEFLVAKLGGDSDPGTDESLATDCHQVPQGTPAQVTGLAVTDVSVTRLSASWNAAAGATGYRVLYWEASGTEPGWGSAVDVGNVTNYTIPNLDPATSYTVKVRAYNGNGDGPASDPDTHSTRTLTEPTWSLGDDGHEGGSQRRFKVTLSGVNATGLSGHRVYDVTGGGSSLVHTETGGGTFTWTSGLYDEGSTRRYEVRAYAEGTDVDGTPEGTSTFKEHTLAYSQPSPLSIVSVTAISPWQFRLELSGGTPAAEWDVKHHVKPPGGGEPDFSGTPVAHTTSGDPPQSPSTWDDPDMGSEHPLTPGETYEVQAIARNGDKAAESNAAEVTLPAATPEILNEVVDETTDLGTGGQGYSGRCTFDVNSATRSVRIEYRRWDSDSVEITSGWTQLQDMDVTPGGTGYASNDVLVNQCDQLQFRITGYNQYGQAGSSVQDTTSQEFIDNYGADACGGA